jgi:predicted RNase H-like nuclease (RuvC/YqgF family)
MNDAKTLRGNSTFQDIDNPEEVIKEKGDYFTRIEHIQKGLERSIEEKQLELEKYERKIHSLSERTIQELIETGMTSYGH